MVNDDEDLRSINEADVTIGFKSLDKSDPNKHNLGFNFNVVNEYSNILILDDPFSNETNIFDGIF